MIAGIGSAGNVYAYQKLSASDMFDKTDANQDGKIDESEFASIPNNGDNVSKVFSEMDADQDGALSQEEHEALFKKLQENTDLIMAQRLSMEVSSEEIFGNIDANQDGVIDQTEFETAGSSADSAEEVFSVMDTNEDGTVSQEELRAFMGKMRENGPVSREVQQYNKSQELMDEDITSVLEYTV